MARSKQVTPMRREPSSEYVSKQDRTTPGKESVAVNKATFNGSAHGANVGQLAKHEAGVVTLVIDVAGIYASL
jgi:UDP-galactose transporter B1